MSITRSSPSVHQNKWPKSKPVITIDVFKVSPDRFDDLFDDWNYLLSEFSQFDNFNSINLYQNLSHNKTTWILQIEWKSSQHLNEALSHADFQEFQNFLNQWNIAISQEPKKYVPQIYRKFPGINFDQAISTPKPPWRISTNSIIIIAFVFGIAVALLILILR